MVTRDDVAKLAGVSPSTVSHVLNNTRFVSDELREKVLKAVGELRYTPNLIARSLTTKKSNQVALIVNDIANPFYGEIALGMESAAIEKGYILMLGWTTIPSFTS
jgi:DNA-binding LacI/PurR family transcriptional regulator